VYAQKIERHNAPVKYTVSDIKLENVAISAALPLEVARRFQL